eukprot:6189280-Pleurochrysis_carterae.AAC.1
MHAYEYSFGSTGDALQGRASASETRKGGKAPTASHCTTVSMEGQYGENALLLTTGEAPITGLASQAEARGSSTSKSRVGKHSLKARRRS